MKTIITISILIVLGCIFIPLWLIRVTRRQKKEMDNQWRHRIPFLLLILCCSCGTTVSIQGVKVHSPTKATPRRDALLYAGAVVAGYAVADHLTSAQTKNAIKQKLTP